MEGVEELVEKCSFNMDINTEKGKENLNMEETDTVQTMSCLENNSQVHKHEDSEERLTLRRNMLNHLSIIEKVFFKSLSEDEEDLNKEQKVSMAGELLDRDYGLFLAKFGNHLLKEHLVYFENRSEEDSVIVDIYLKQLTRVLERQSSQCSSSSVEKNNVSTSQNMEESSKHTGEEKVNLRNQLLDHLSLSKDAHFRSQQIGEPDLSAGEKRNIAEELLDRNDALFLSRFGTHLLEEHLDYFDHRPSENRYEVTHHLRQLRKTHCKVVSEVGIKNRRFEALKKMVEEGSYFCETEMRNRNPLLYEQLVGRFLTADERHDRLSNIDTTNITFVNLLLEQMDREAVKKLRKEQEDAEDDVIEEEEDGCDEKMEAESDSEDDNDLDKTLWGEGYTDNKEFEKSNKREIKKSKENKHDENTAELSDAEKCLLMEEFRSNMFTNFLQGKDPDFDYSQVDYNSDYDDLEAQGLDAEEKYFDEESSHSASHSKMSEDEDMLDQFMDKLQPDPTPGQLADKIEELGRENHKT